MSIEKMESAQADLTRQVRWGGGFHVEMTWENAELILTKLEMQNLLLRAFVQKQGEVPADLASA